MWTCLGSIDCVNIVLIVRLIVRHLRVASIIRHLAFFFGKHIYRFRPTQDSLSTRPTPLKRSTGSGPFPPSSGLRRLSKRHFKRVSRMGEARNQHFEDQRQHLAQGSCLVLTWDEYPDFPISGQIGAPIPVPGRIGNRGFPDSRFWPNRESGIPSPIPGQIGNRGNGNRGFGGLHGTVRIPQICR